MIALSIQQPWAWLIVNGYKDIENRSWPTKFRGEFLIHAGKKIDEDGWAWVVLTFPEIPLPMKFETGGIVGKATIRNCVTEHKSSWFFGKYGYTLKDAKPLPFTKLRGMQKFFRVPDELCGSPA